MNNPHTETLYRYLHLHSTPGDEELVSTELLKDWHRAGLRVKRLGTHAVLAQLDRALPTKRTLLICAHMDSPGYAVERISEGRATLIPLGGAHFDEETTPGILKTRHGQRPVTIRQRLDQPPPEAPVTDDEEDEADTPGGRPEAPAAWIETDTVNLDYGDRVCFRADPQFDDGLVRSPFLDNRLGCAMLSELGFLLPALSTAFRVVLGATAAEELGGFGAPVLARAVAPDIAICLDATYEAPEQEVELGKGPVLTLSDASVILSPALRDTMQAWFSAHAMPLQTEVYNVSGTDARAFPHQGLQTIVLPLLIATRGNHSPEETAALADIAYMLNALQAFITTPPDLVDDECSP